MQYDLADIETFLAVVETGTISAAAVRLDLAKSVVSQRISRLEGALGAELIVRSSKGVTPTDGGLGFYQRARSILAQLDEAAESMQENDDASLRGVLRIAGPMSFGVRWLAPALYSFAKRHPMLTLSFDLDDRLVDLLAGGYDVGIRVGDLSDANLVARRLAVARRLIVCSPEYARAHGLPRTLDELSGHTAIGYSLLHNGQVWRFEPARKGAEPLSVTMSCGTIINNGDAICEAVIAGLGIALLPSFIVADGLRSGRLVDATPPGQKLIATAIHAMYPHTRHPSRKVQRLVEHLRDAFADGALWDRGLHAQAAQSSTTLPD